MYPPVFVLVKSRRVNSVQGMLWEGWEPALKEGPGGSGQPRTAPFTVTRTSA